eukprot:8401331-Alexandrium_andersonii.AAC.1
MSASLVGSEMCIRDRSSNCTRSTMLQMLAASFSCLDVAAQTTLRASWCTVSYTHLTLPTICSV